MNKHNTSTRLAAKQEVFVNEYLVDLNAARAAARAGYSPDYGSELLRNNPKVREAVSRAMQQRNKRTQISQDRILEELALIAFGDLRGVASWGASGVRLAESADLTVEQAAALAEVSETAKGLLKVKRHDKVKALELLMRHLGMLSEKINASAAVDLGALQAARERVRAEFAAAGDAVERQK